MIHVCYAFTDQKGTYSQIVGTSMTSLLTNTSEEITVHLLHDNSLTNNNRDNFIKIAHKFNCSIIFYNLEILTEDKIKGLRNSINSVLNIR